MTANKKRELNISEKRRKLREIIDSRVSVGAYAGFGASASVGWDLDRIIAELEKIWLE